MILHIEESKEKYAIFSNFNNHDGCLNISSSIFDNSWFTNKTLYYDSLRCLLYQGIRAFLIMITFGKFFLVHKFFTHAITVEF